MIRSANHPTQRGTGLGLALAVITACATADKDGQLSDSSGSSGEDADTTDGGVDFRGGTLVPSSRVCVKVETAWLDAMPANTPGGGDFWRENANRPASGARITIGGNTMNLGNDGCLLFTTPGGLYTMVVESQGTVNGIDITSYTDWVPDGPDAGTVPDLSGNFVVASSLFLRSGTINETLVLPASDLVDSIAWHPYVLMAYAMTRSTMHLDDHGNDSGCGPATVPCCGHVDWVDADDDHDNVAPTHLVSYTMRSGAGWASTWSETDEVDSNGTRSFGYGGLFSGGDSDATANSVVALGSGSLKKWPMAHELGHMLVMARVGMREETNYSAELYDCMGQYHYDGNGVLQPSDSGAAEEKAPLTREYSSGASREGWADFYAAQLFNDTDESDCWMQSHTFMDFDLDGDVDNEYGIAYKDGVFTCEGAGVEPSLGEPDPSDPLASWVHSRDWLDEAWANACGDPSSPAGITGRSSQYDWTRYFWDMATDEGVPVEELSDIYVDMCPSNWVAGPGSVPNSNWPELRLERAADFHGHAGAHDLQQNNGVAHF